MRRRLAVALSDRLSDGIPVGDWALVGGRLRATSGKRWNVDLLRSPFLPLARGLAPSVCLAGHVYWAGLIPRQYARSSS